MKRCSYLVVALLAIACSPSAATTSGVRVETADPPDACERTGKIKAYASNTDNDDATVRENMRAQAESTGANYVKLDKLESSDSQKRYTGTTYKCPPGTLP